MNFAIFRAMCLIKVLFFVSLNLFHGIHGLENQQQLPANQLVVINHGFCQSCSREFKSLKDVHTYSDLKYDPRASLPSSFTICVNLFLTTNDVETSLFTILGSDGQPWFSAKMREIADVVEKQFYYPQQNHVAQLDTVRVFANQWFRSCFAFNTMSGLVQFVLRGELIDNSTLEGITNNVPTDLSGKVIFGSYYLATRAKWYPSGRVAEVAREHGWHPLKCLDSDENSKPQHNIRYFVAN